jgi:Zn-dependent peptidase ImmA (M78 family)
MNYKTLRRRLARDFPLSRRVVVFEESPEEMDEAGALGVCWFEESTIYIGLAKAAPAEQAHTLAHEWAHARVCDRHGKLMHRHSREWAEEFARIYKRYWD